MFSFHLGADLLLVFLIPLLVHGRRAFFHVRGSCLPGMLEPIIHLHGLFILDPGRFYILKNSKVVFTHEKSICP